MDAALPKGTVDTGGAVTGWAGGGEVSNGNVPAVGATAASGAGGAGSTGGAGVEGAGATGGGDEENGGGVTDPAEPEGVGTAGAGGSAGATGAASGFMLLAELKPCAFAPSENRRSATAGAIRA
jgi:hypothetical protein